MRKPISEIWIYNDTVFVKYDGKRDNARKKARRLLNKIKKGGMLKYLREVNSCYAFKIIH